MFEHREPLIGRRRAVVDDVTPRHAGAHALEIIAVHPMELDPLGNVVEVAADHVVDPDDLVTIGEERIGKVAPQEAGDPRDENLLFHLVPPFGSGSGPSGVGSHVSLFRWPH